MGDEATNAHVVIGHTSTLTAPYPIVNPARLSEVVGQASNATPNVMERAIQSAALAFPEWSTMAVRDRAELLGHAADELEPSLEELADLLTREHGKLLAESRKDVGSGPRLLRYYAGLADRLSAPDVVEDQRGRIVTRWRPVGVTGVIVPWNAPVLLGFLMIAPALLAGNTLVVKPSELAPLTVTRVLTILSRCLPPGVVNVVPAVGAEAAQLLTTHGSVRRVVFTGSTATGRMVMAQAAGTIKNLSLELGGNDPAIVLDDAVVDDALVHGLRRGVFDQAGQTCLSVKRIYVHRSRYEDFVEAFVATADEIVVGDGRKAQSTMGPVNSAGQRSRIEGLVAAAQAEGEIHMCGRALDPEGWQDGHFLLPMVATGLSPTARLVTEEQFGPVVPVLAYDDLDEAVGWANATEYGLNTSVWTSDPDRAFALADRLEAGTVFVNVHRGGASDYTMPFGGVKQSGFGRTHGWRALEEASELQVLAHRTDL